MRQRTESTKPFSWPNLEASAKNLAHSERRVTVRTSNAVGAFLLDRGGKYPVETWVLASVIRTLAEWSGQDDVSIEVEKHGRGNLFAELDISETIGWFTALTPVTFKAAQHSFDDIVDGVHQKLRLMTEDGLGYGLARYYADCSEFSFGPSPEISFNYLGRTDLDRDQNTIFSPVPGITGAHRSPSGVRPYRLEINAALDGDALETTWTYGDSLDGETVETLALALCRTLEDHADRVSEASLSASAEHLGIDDLQMDNILAELSLGDDRST